LAYDERIREHFTVTDATGNLSEAERLLMEQRDRDEKRMTIVEHLAELRTRLLWSIATLAVATAIAFYFAPAIFEFLKAPAGGTTFITTEPTEAFGAYFKVALLAGLIISIPMHIYQVVMYIAPGLLPNEKAILRLFLPFAAVSFLAGVIFGYYFLLPPALTFLLQFGVEHNVATPQIRISSYIDLVTRLLFWIGVAFETPVFMLILGRLGILTYDRIVPIRRYALVGAWVIAAIITPTFDPVNQTVVAVPLMLLFELGAQLVRIFGKKRSAEPAA
jgi:sec-independent protein translocase protein TatC